MEHAFFELQRRHRRDCWWCLVLGPLFVVAILSLSGCGSAGPKLEGRQEVAGEVTLDGNPLSAGMIEFVPQGNGKGPRAMVEIKEGKFVLDKDHGPVSGPMRVEITTPLGDDEPPTDGTRPKPFQRETIPERYNRRSTLSADVKKEGENVFQFSLKTR